MNWDKYYKMEHYKMSYIKTKFVTNIKVCDMKMDWNKWFIRWSIFSHAKIKFYSDAYTVVKWRITVGRTNNANKRIKKWTCKNNAPFKSWHIKN